MVLLCAVSLVGVAVVGPMVGAAQSPPEDLLPDESMGEDGVQSNVPPLEPKQIVMSFHVGANGTASASVAYWIPLDDQASVAGFERFQEKVRTNRSRYTRRFERRIRATVANAERTTGRRMSTENVTVRAYREPQKYGIVEYSYRWNGFGAAQNDELIVGPALGGLHLSEETRLFISWPADYRVKTVANTVSERRDQSAVWEGPMTFDRGGPRIVLERDRGLRMDLFSGSAGPFSIVGRRLVPIAAMATLLIVIGGVALRKRRPWVGSTLWPGLLAAVPIGSGEDGDVDEPETDRDGPDDLTGDAEEPVAEAGGESATRERTEPPELMSDREALLWELEKRGGREKQKTLVETLGWSDAKGSRLISKLRENDEVETFRLGNENVLTLPGEQGLLGNGDGDDNGGERDG
ncbi:helix-turn-helix transcriptional regulator [Haloparvum sp. AD34]